MVRSAQNSVVPAANPTNPPPDSSRTDRGAITGTIRAQQGNPAQVGGTVTGKNIAFTVKRRMPVGELTQQFAGTVNAKPIAGSVAQDQFHVTAAAQSSVAPNVARQAEWCF